MSAKPAELNVSRETKARLDHYVDALQKWAPRINLVGQATIEDIWSRHVADSLQILSYGQPAGHWVDFGSGAGLPGMVLAACLEDQAGSRVDLVESNRKKTAFLQHVRPSVAPRVKIHSQRIEDAILTLPTPDFVTARAVAPLDTLLRLAAPWLSGSTVGLFPKGRGYREEMRDSEAAWDYDCVVHDSTVDSQSVILEICGLKHRPGKTV